MTAMPFDVSLSLGLEKAARNARRAAVEADYAAGVPVADISKKYALSPAYVVKIARQAQLTRYTSRKGVEEQMVERYRNGDPINSICAATGVDRKTVWSMCRRAGVTLRKSRRITQ